MEKIEHAQTIVSLNDKKKLIEVTGQSTTKEALRVAIEFTIKNFKGVI